MKNKLSCNLTRRQTNSPFRLVFRVSAIVQLNLAATGTVLCCSSFCSRLWWRFLNHQVSAEGCCCHEGGGLLARGNLAALRSEYRRGGRNGEKKPEARCLMRETMPLGCGPELPIWARLCGRFFGRGYSDDSAITTTDLHLRSRRKSYICQNDFCPMAKIIRRVMGNVLSNQR